MPASNTPARRHSPTSLISATAARTRPDYAAPVTVT
jgi:hypothetical protein